MLFCNILIQKFAFHLRKVHIAKMHFFEILGLPHFSLCSLPSAAGSLKRTKKHRVIEIRFLVRMRGVEISVGDMCHKTAGFTTCCLFLWCRRCSWSVIEPVTL